MTPQLSVSLVLYNPNFDELGLTLRSLEVALSQSDVSHKIHIVDNSPSSEPVKSWLKSHFPLMCPGLVSGRGNVGFGRGNNFCLYEVGDYHLILNPDVELAPDALRNALDFMGNNQECGLLTPLAYGANGERQFLCKRFPGIFDLGLRGFAPRWIRQLFKKRLERYEMAEMSENQVFWDPPIVSGCFMLFRGDVLKSLNGFDPDYFLYFEDFDLSLRAAEISRIAFTPQVRIIHGGGYASRKGAWHIWQFVKSGVTFYRKFGLKLM